MDSQMKKGLLVLCVLATLKKKECYGYELVSRISESVSIAEGTIYPLLHRLTKEGLVETYFVPSSVGPSRKYYRLTDDGENAYAEQSSEWKELSKGISKLMHR